MTRKIAIPLSVIVTGILVIMALKSRPDTPRPEGLLIVSEIESRIDSILRDLTIEEKIGQLVQYSNMEELTGPGEKSDDVFKKANEIKTGRVGSILNAVDVRSTRKLQELALSESRHKIPLMFGYDVIHGFKTMFPVPLGEAASWDMEAIEASARIGAIEAAAAGIHWTFAPMVDISRDARWGRVMEGAGEDVFLASEIARARVMGFQGDDLEDTMTIAACAKHFAGYGLAEAGRDYNTTEITDNTLYNVVLPPFKACVEAGVATVMNAFNDLGGIPATGHEDLQRNVLKEEWSFNGFVVSDWGSIDQMINHGYAADKKEAARIALNAGSDMDMEGYCYQENLKELIEKNLVKEATLDDAVRRVLRVKYHLGIMDDPFKYISEEREEKSILTEEHLEISRDVARKSIVLLKNDGDILPISNAVRSIAVIGPLADDKDSPLGNWRAQAVSNSAVSLLEGIQAAVGTEVKVTYQKGCELVTGERAFGTELQINHTDRSGIKKAQKIAREADLVVLALGEDCYQSGEGRSQVDIGLSGLQNELFDAIRSVNSNLVTVLMNGRPLAIPKIAEESPALVEAWHLGSQAGHAITDILFGKYNPSGKLPISFPRHVGQCPIYYARKSTGRGNAIDQVFWSHYTDESNDPLFPFGFGLSYTTFEYSDLRISSENLAKDSPIKVSVDITNTGEREGSEVVQLYIQDMIASPARPVMELKGFEKIHLGPGETREVSFSLTEEDLRFYTTDGKWKSEPGEFRVMVGPNCVEYQELKFNYNKT